MSHKSTPKSPPAFNNETLHYAANTSIYINTYQYDDISDLHYHDHSGAFELALVTRGFGYHYINNHVKEVSKGDVLFIDPESWHSLFPVDPQNSTCLQVINCIFAPNIFHALEPLLPQLTIALDDLTMPGLQHPLITAGNQLDRDLSAVCQPLIHHMEYLYRQNDEQAEQSILLVLGFMVLEIYRKLSQFHTGLDQKAQNPILQRALQKIHDCYLDPDFVISDLYSQLYISKSHLCALFRASMDITPVQLLNNLRIQYACKLLRQELCGIKKDFHRRCGYHEYNTFYINFKKITGLSVRDYGKALKFGMSIEKNTAQDDMRKNGI